MQLKFIKIIFLIFLGFFYFGYSPSVSKSDVVNSDNNYMYSKVDIKESILEKTERTYTSEETYLARIIISKIGLNRPLYSLNSKLNTVDKNIEILKNSDMPDVINGNFILAAHNGYSLISYFHNLHKLQIGDEVNINYNDKKYTYRVSKIYDVIKTGKVAVKRDKNKTTITMITCKDDDKQLVVIGYLV